MSAMPLTQRVDGDSKVSAEDGHYAISAPLMTQATLAPESYIVTY